MMRADEFLELETPKTQSADAFLDAESFLDDGLGTSEPDARDLSGLAEVARYDRRGPEPGAIRQPRTDDEPQFGDYLGATPGMIAEGLGGAVGGTVEGFGLIADRAQRVTADNKVTIALDNLRKAGENLARAQEFPEYRNRDQIIGKAKEEFEQRQQQLHEATVALAEQKPSEAAQFLRELGVDIQELGRSMGPGDDLQGVYRDLTTGLGSMLAYYGPGLVAGAVTRGSGLASLGTAAAMAGPAGVSEQYARAKQSGLSEDEALAVAMKGIPGGVVQVAPIAALIRPLPAEIQGKAIGQLYGILRAAGSEFVAENAGAIMQNLVEQSYNPEKGTWDDTPYQGLIAGGSSAILQTAIQLVTRGRGMNASGTQTGRVQETQPAAEQPGAVEPEQAAPGTEQPEPATKTGDWTDALLAEEFLDAPVQPEVAQQGIDATPEEGFGLNPFEQAPAQPEAAQTEQVEQAPVETESLTERGTGVFRVPVDQIQVDPEQYQFRSRVNEQGVDQRLSGVEQWDDNRAGSVLLHRRNDGSLYVADGHHRVDLARRLGQGEINARVIDEADGFDVSDARVEAAMNNIADGKAEPLDVAKVFRDSGIPVEQVRRRYDLPNNQVARDGEALAKLTDNVFGLVSSGQLSEKDGAAIGNAFTESGQQEAAASTFQRIEPSTDYQRQLLINELRAAEFAETQGEQGGLFGDDAQEISLMQQRLQVLDALRQRLNSDKRLFKSLNDNADRASEAGNRIATEANESITQESARTLDLIGRVTTTPALNEMVNRAARRVYDGENRAAVVTQLKQELMAYERGQAQPDSGRPSPAQSSQPANESGDERRTGERVPEQDAREADQGGQPESGQQTEVAPTLDLETQTEEQLAEQARTQKEAAEAEARQKREAEQREKADAEADDFVLSGSNSAIDQAEARGQGNMFDTEQATEDSGGVKARRSSYRASPNQQDLFADPQELEALKNVDPYESAETRPGTTEAQHDAGRSALRDLLRQLNARYRRTGRTTEAGGGISLLGAAMYKNFKAGKPNQLIGQTVRTPQDLAALAQVYRDPRFETFRLVLTKNGKVVTEQAVTSRLPSTVRFHDDYIDDLRSAMKATGADGYYMMHNHPSGKSEPSAADLRATLRTVDEVPGFLSHVVIDHNEFSTIDKYANVELTKDESLGSTDFWADPDQPNDLLGFKISSGSDVAELAKKLQNDQDRVVFIGADAKNKVTLLTSLPASLMMELSSKGSNRAEAIATLRRLKRASGSGGYAFLAVNDKIDVRTFAPLINDGIVMDVVDPDGNSGHVVGDPKRYPGDAIEANIRGMRISEDSDNYQPTDDIRFSRTGPRNLFVAHNLSESNLEHVLELGGLAAPSLAVGRTDQGFADFGEITLLAPASMLESPKARTFDADVYTPRHPRAEYEINREAYAKQVGKLDNEYDLATPALDDLERGGMEAMARSPAYQYAWLKSKGRAPKAKRQKVDPVVRKIAKLGLDRFAMQADPRVIKLAEEHYRDVQRQMREALGDDARGIDRFFDEDGSLGHYYLTDLTYKAASYNESGGYDIGQMKVDLHKKMRQKLTQRQYERWIKDQFNEVMEGQRMFNGFTPSGNKKYRPYTLENVVKEMTRQVQGGEGFNYGAGSVRSAYAKEMRRVSEVQANRDRIVSPSQMEAIKEESNKRLQDTLEALKPYYKFDADGWGYRDDASSAIAEGRKGWNEAFNLDADSRSIITEFVDYLRNLPTAYFETKVGRAVDLSEFSVALVPKGTSKEAVDALRAKGLKVKRYDQDDPDSRRQEIARQEDLLFSREGDYRRTPDTQIESLTAEEARTVANGLMKGWKGRPGLTVTDSISEFPARLRQAIRDAGAESDMRAVFWNQHVYVLAPRIPNRAALEEVILHEVVGHYGLRKMVGGELKPLLDRVYRDLGDSARARVIKRVYFANNFDATNTEHRLTVAEELLAHLAESGKHQHRTLWQRIVTAIRDGLRRLGFTIRMTENDLLKILEGAQRTVERGGFSRPSTADINFKRVILDLTDTALVKDGESARLKNPVTLANGSRLSGFTDPDTQEVFFGYDKNGELFTVRRERVNPDDIVSSRDSNRTADKIRESLQAMSAEFSRTSQTNTEAFRKWFGDSKVVDENGQPLVVYHGTDEQFDVFDPAKAGMGNDRGMRGRGLYFSPNDRTAASYGKNVMPVYVSIQNPFTPSDFASKEAIAQRLGIDESIFEYGPDSGFKVYQPYSGTFTSALKEAGYDGVIYPDRQEVIAFNPNQIKSATDNAGTFDPANPDIRFSRMDEESGQEIRDRQVKFWDGFATQPLDRMFRALFDVTGTPEFRAWFGDSKVVDENGEPLAVYHGTGTRFDTFDESRMGSFTGADSASEGFFFTDSRSLAGQFRDNAQRARTPLPDIRDAVEALDDARFEALADDLGMVEDFYTDGREFVTDQIIERMDEDRSAFFDDRSNFDQTLKQYIDPDLFSTGEVKSVYLAISNPREVTVDPDTAFDDGLITREVRAAKKAGNDGLIIRGMLDTAAMDDKGNNQIASDVYVAFRPEQIKSATDNAGTFDPANPDIRFSRMDEESGQEIRDRQVKFWDGFATQPLDRMFRALFDVTGMVDSHGRLKKGVEVTRGAERILKEWRPNPNGHFAWVDTILETARHGLLDRYKLTDDYKMTWRQAEAYGRNLDMQAMDILKTLEDRGVSGVEAAVLQKVLTGESVGDHQMQAVAAPIRRAIDDLGQAAVEYGIITREQFERNRGEYLHRSYLRHESEFTGLGKWIHKQQRNQNRKIKGDTAKGRGIEVNVPTSKLMQHVPVGWYGIQKQGQKPDMQALNGQKFVVLENPGVIADRSGTLEGVETAEQPRTTETVYWPASQPVPAKYEAWRKRGTFEVRRSKKDKVVLWRDYTKAEREHMGEILDARFNIAKTFQLLSRDLAMGKFFHDVSLNPEWFTREKPVSDSILSAREANSLHTLSKADWVEVPDTTVSGSAGTRQWGALAGGWVRAEIWRDLNELDKMHNPGMWRKVLTQWKLNKTARSPVVHMNNVMSNLVLMDLADVRVTDLVKGIQSYRARDEHWRAAQEYGAFEGTFINEEIRKQELDPILDELTKQNLASATDADGAVQSLSRMAYTLWSNIKKFDNAMTQFYQVEDELFRMATYMRRLDLGDTPIDAARTAREQFLDYDIRAPWVNAARRTVLPFISYTYRAVPVVAQSIIHRPWKLAKYFTLAYLANSLSYLLAPGDEDEERRTMRDNQQGMTWIGTPRMLRMPWHDEHGNPVFMDIRRWIPAGDVFDMNQGNSALPVPAPVQFGGPLMLAFEFALNKQAFTGEEIVNRDTDTATEAAGKTADWLYKSWMPSGAYIPGSFYWDRFWTAQDGGRDILGRPYSVPQALLSSIGIKVQPHDVRLGYEFRSRDLAAEARMITADVRRARSDLDRNIITQGEYLKITARAKRKMERLKERQDRLQGRD